MRACCSGKGRGASSVSVGSRGDQETQARRAAARAHVLDDTAQPELARRVRRLMDQKYGWSDRLVVQIEADVRRHDGP
jgi:hypothetical protein